MTEEILTAEPPVPGGARKLDGNEKLAVEMGPLVFLGLGYFLPGTFGPPLDRVFGTEMFSAEGGELFVALALFLPAFAVAFAWSAVRARRVAPMLWITGVIAFGMGGLTFAFQDKTFFYIKPTLIYAATALALGGGLLAGRNFLKLLFDGAFEMDEAGWRVLTWRFVAFNLAAAVANEILWRTLTGDCVEGVACGGEKVWMNIKIFGFTAAYFVFVAANAPFLMKRAKFA